MPHDHDEELGNLRGEIEDADRQLFTQLGRRLDLARRIGEVKITAGLPLRDFRVETEVLERGERLSRRIGLDPAVGRELVGILLRGSLRVQEDLRERSYRGTLRRVAVVGGRGRMGSWLVHFLHGQGHHVSVIDPAGPLEGFPHAAGVEEMDPATEVCLLSVPLGTAADLYEGLLDGPGDPLLVDILSVKSPVASVIRRGIGRGRRIASIHPLFGPDIELLSGRVLAVCDCGCPTAAAEARELFAGTSLTFAEVGLEEHDELMAIVLGLSHAVSIAYFHALRLSGWSPRDLARMASTTFSRQVAVAAEVAGESPDLYHEIQHLNPNTEKTFALLLRAVSDLRERALDPNADAFASLMREGRAYLQGIEQR